MEALRVHEKLYQLKNFDQRKNNHRQITIRSNDGQRRTFLKFPLSQAALFAAIKAQYLKNSEGYLVQHLFKQAELLHRLLVRC